MTLVAVTGASGFVARHLIPQLVEGGHEVRGMARSAVDPGVTSGTADHFEFRKGDVRHDTAVDRLLDGCEAVVHLAASFNPGDRGEEIITIGTDNVVAAARNAGVKRLVFVSCLGADAAAPFPFQRAKWQAEQLVRSSEIPFTILRPSVIVGRDDGIVRPLADLLRSWPVAPVPRPGRNRVQPVDVADVARCVVASLTDEKVENETVSVGGPVFLTYRQLVDLVAGELGMVKAKLLLPPPALSAIAALIPVSSRSLFSPARLAEFRHTAVASPGIIQRSFGFEPADILTRLPAYLA